MDKKRVGQIKAQFDLVIHSDETAKIELQKWYLHDKGISIQNEIVELHENILA